MIFSIASEYYDPSANNWTKIAAPASIIGISPCMTVGGDNNIYVFGNLS